MRMKLVAREALINRMNDKGWSGRRLHRYLDGEVKSHSTIDNLLNGKTQALNNPRAAELICEALDLPFEVIFVPEISSNTERIGQRHAAKRRVA